MARTLFISDLHLSPERPDILRLFHDWIAGLDAGSTRALYILGDLFEAWVGDDEDDPELLTVPASLRALAERGVPVFTMRGNRDFLLGSGFERASGSRLLEDPARIELQGRSVLLMHGDTLCTDDHDYQAFRARVRDPGWQATMLSRPLEERRRIAAELRAQSERSTAGKRPEIMDVNPEAVAAAFRDHDVDLIIHGHTHRPAIHESVVDGRPRWRIVLGDWYDYGSVLEADARGGFVLRRLTMPA